MSAGNRAQQITIQLTAVCPGSLLPIITCRVLFIFSFCEALKNLRYENGAACLDSSSVRPHKIALN